MTPVAIPADEARRIKADKGQPSVLSMLRAGQMVWLPGKKPSSIGGFRTALRADNRVIRTKRAERDGQAGIYVWAVPID